MDPLSPLLTFLPAVRAWFEARFITPTPPQALGWPAIQRGENTLILSPTGSGKTLSAFLWGIDQIYRQLLDELAISGDKGKPVKGVRILYISPLKALNNGNDTQATAYFNHYAREFLSDSHKSQSARDVQNCSNGHSG